MIRTLQGPFAGVKKRWPLRNANAADSSEITRFLYVTIVRALAVSQTRGRNVCRGWILIRDTLDIENRGRHGRKIRTELNQTLAKYAARKCQ